MKICTLYILSLSLVLASCNFENNDHSHKIVKQKVFVIDDERSSDSLKQESENVDTSYIEALFKNYDLVNIKSLDSSIRVNLKYSDTNNFVKYNLYDGLRNAYFNCETALRVSAAQFYLKQINPDR